MSTIIWNGKKRGYWDLTILMLPRKIEMTAQKNCGLRRNPVG